jgi:hypothetical protein
VNASARTFESEDDIDVYTTTSPSVFALAIVASSSSPAFAAGVLDAAALELVATDAVGEGPAAVLPPHAARRPAMLSSVMSRRLPILLQLSRTKVYWYDLSPDLTGAEPRHDDGRGQETHWHARARRNPDIIASRRDRRMVAA